MLKRVQRRRPPRLKGKVDKSKVVAEEPPKRKKLSHSNYRSSKFNTTVDHPPKPAVPLAPILMEATTKATKVEAMYRANQKARKEEEEWASKASAIKTPKKFERFLAGQDEEITPTVLEMLLLEVCASTANFYKFWTNGSSCICPSVTRWTSLQCW